MTERQAKFGPGKYAAAAAALTWAASRNIGPGSLFNFTPVVGPISWCRCRFMRTGIYRVVRACSYSHRKGGGILRSDYPLAVLKNVSDALKCVLFEFRKRKL